MLSFDLDVIARRDPRRIGLSWFAAVLATLLVFAAHGSAHANRLLASGTVGTPYSQNATVYTDTLACNYGMNTFSVAGLTLTNTSSSLTCSFRLDGTPTAAGTFSGTYQFHTNSGNFPSDAVLGGFFSVGYDITIAKASPSLSVSAPSAGTYTNPLTLTATLSNAVSPTGTVTFYDNGTPIGTSSVSGTTASLTISTLSVGSHAITASYGGDSNHEAATSASAATVTVTKTTPSIALNTSASSPSYGSSVALVATMSGSASPSGTVTFYDGATQLGNATISGTTAILMVSSLAMGAHTISAVYNGDTNNASVTSSTGTVTVVQLGRPDPTSDTTVRGLVSSQVASAVRFGQTQIGNIFSRFEALHDEDDGAANGSGGSRQMVQGGTGPGNIASAGGNATGDTRAANPLDSQASAASALGYASDLPIRTSLATQNDAGRAVSQLSAALPQAVDALNKTNVLPFHVWASGTVGFGRLQNDNSFDNRFTTSGLTLGFDRRILDDLKAGMAVGLGFERTDVGTDGSRIDANSFDATLYASWRFLPHTYLDVAGGYGALRFDSKRWSSDGNVMLSGGRSGRDVFGTVGISHVSKWDGFRLLSYGRLDVVRASLDGYSETGSSTWALNYDRMNTTSVASVLGGRLAYPILQNWGVLTPAVRAEWRHAFDGGYVQGLNYVDLAGLTSGYALSGTSTARDTMTGGLSLRADVGNALSLDLEYLLTSSLNGVESQRLRGAVKYGF